MKYTAFGLFVAGGLMLFLFGNNWTSYYPTNDSTLYKAALAALFLAAALICRRTPGGRPLAAIALALFFAALANLVNWGLGNWLGRLLPPAASELQALAIDKVSQCIPVAATLIGLTLLSGDRPGSIFLQRGNLGGGLRFGLISFAGWAVLAVVLITQQAMGPAGGQGLGATGIPVDVVLAGLPWILVFIFANSLMEEIWFRGIFLNRLQPVMGAGLAALATALIFGLPHATGDYLAPAERLIFGGVVIALGLVNAAAMFKTRSILGSLLFHAGYDLIVIVPVLASG